MNLINSVNARKHQDIIRRAGEIVEKNTGAGTYCVLAQIDMDDYNAPHCQDSFLAFLS